MKRALNCKVDHSSGDKKHFEVAVKCLSIFEWDVGAVSSDESSRAFNEQL